MSGLTHLAEQIGNNLISVGLGLDAIGNMLGADGADRHLSDADLNGLRHAALALAAYIKAAGYDLCESAETVKEGGGHA